MTPRIQADAQHVDRVLSWATAAVEKAREVRAENRRRRRPDRVVELTGALMALQASMSEVRPLVHAATVRSIPRDDELRAVSRSIQAERRKLRKMLERTPVEVAGIGEEWS